MNAIRIAQTVGITAAGWCAGGTLCISYYYVPAILLAPTPLNVQQWNHSFDTGKIVHAGLALISSAAYGFVAYKWQGTLRQREAELYGLCIAANLAIWPLTLLVIMPTNKKLWQKYEESKSITGASEQVTEAGLPKGESAKELIDHWGMLNVFRGCLPLFSTILGAYISTTASG